jgi:hypothetical protein
MRAGRTCAGAAPWMRLITYTCRQTRSAACLATRLSAIPGYPATRGCSTPPVYHSARSGRPGAWAKPAQGHRAKGPGEFHQARSVARTSFNGFHAGAALPEAAAARARAAGFSV